MMSVRMSDESENECEEGFSLGLVLVLASEKF